MAKNPPNEEQDKRCAHRDEDDNQCGAYHTKESPYCFIHAGNLEKLTEARSKNAKRHRDLREDLEFGYHNLSTLEDIAAFYEKLINGLLANTIKKDKAQAIFNALSAMSKLAKDRHQTSSGNRQQIGVLNINVGNLETARLAAMFQNPQHIDEFLLSNESISVQMIEDLRKEGAVTVEAKPLPAEEPEEELDLFAEVTPPKHDWKGEFKTVPEKGIAELWFTCQNCGAVAPNIDKPPISEEVCPTIT
jgi:hypothetical protein